MNIFVVVREIVNRDFVVVDVSLISAHADKDDAEKAMTEFTKVPSTKHGDNLYIKPVILFT